MRDITSTSDRPPRPPTHRPRSGFTLIEILAVVVILGISAAVIVPQISGREDLQSQAGARIVVSDLLYAQNLAIATQSMVYVKFEAANNRYSLLSAVPPATETLLKNPVTLAGYTTQFAASGTSAASIKLGSALFKGVDPATAYQTCFTIAFDELGTPYVYSYTNNLSNDLLSGTVKVTAGTYTTTITVDRYTGNIKVQ